MTTETKNKIKEAAHTLFKQKGLAATSTRDIAKEAGVNLALLNYYFKSKELLYNEIMMETIIDFRNVIIIYLNDEKDDFRTKTEKLVNKYIDTWLEEPELPLFVIEGMQHPQSELITKINPRNIIIDSAFAKQMKEISGNKDIDILQLFINLMAMLAFPFIGKNMIMNVSQGNEDRFRKIIEERRHLIPMWIENMIKGK